VSLWYRALPKTFLCETVVQSEDVECKSDKNGAVENRYMICTGVLFIVRPGSGEWMKSWPYSNQWCCLAF
jgi:hypothetical protein